MRFEEQPDPSPTPSRKRVADPKELMTIKQASAYFEIKVETMYGWVRQGLITAYVIPGDKRQRLWFTPESCKERAKVVLKLKEN